MTNIKIIEDDIIIWSNKNFYKINSETREFVSKEVFITDGNNRNFIIVDGFIYCKDFCDFYKITLDTFDIVKKWRIGTDLTNDICAIGCDEDNLYITVRNGSLCVINRKTEEPKYIKICNSSIWDMIITDVIYAGNVEGDLIVIDKNNFNVINKLNLHKKNLNSILINGNLLYTSSSDLSIKVTDLNTLETKYLKKDVHKKMFKLVGIINNLLVTTSNNFHETKLWKLPNFDLLKTFSFGSTSMILEDEYIFFDDDLGVKYLNLNNINYNNIIENDEITIRLI